MSDDFFMSQAAVLLLSIVASHTCAVAYSIRQLSETGFYAIELINLKAVT
jgi:hypothetical protein